MKSNEANALGYSKEILFNLQPRHTATSQVAVIPLTDN